MSRGDLRVKVDRLQNESKQCIRKVEEASERKEIWRNLNLDSTCSWRHLFVVHGC